MTALANIQSITSSLSLEADVALQRRWTIAWTCTRRRAAAGRMLERVALALDARLRGAAKFDVEAWLEVDGVRARSILPPTTFACTAGIAQGILGIDVAPADEDRIGQPPILKLSIELASDRLLYAQSSLLRAAGLGDGAYDPPILRIPVAR